MIMHERNKLFWVVLLFGILAISSCVTFYDSPPSVSVSTDNGRATADLGSYCWDDLCMDALFPEVDTFVKLASSGEIVVEFRGSQPTNVFMALHLLETFPESDAETTQRYEEWSDGIIWVHGEPAGEYFLYVIAHWPSGNDASYRLGVTIP